MARANDPMGALKTQLIAGGLVITGIVIKRAVEKTPAALNWVEANGPGAMKAAGQAAAGAAKASARGVTRARMAAWRGLTHGQETGGNGASAGERGTMEFIAVDGKTPYTGELPDEIDFIESLPPNQTTEGMDAVRVRRVTKTDPDWEMYLEQWMYRQGWLLKKEGRSSE